ncbi:hypothetical protein MMPV_007193 [Pyropia vietnamensis]
MSVAPSPRVTAASSPARRARMAAADGPNANPYVTGAPKVVPPPGPVQTPAQLAEAAAARAAAATARVAAARQRVEAERAAAGLSPLGAEPPAVSAASTDQEEEANEGDPYLRETMKQYVPPLVTTAFVSGCVALGEAAALVSALLPPL